VSSVGLGLHLVVLYVAVDVLGLELMLSKLIATGSVDTAPIMDVAGDAGGDGGG